MRHKLALTAVLASCFALALPATEAAAYCDPLVSAVTGRCSNLCTVTAPTYNNLDQKTGGKLPDMHCLA